MDVSRVGKFEMRRIVQEFDETLIRLYGVNMRDAAVSRLDALNLYNEVNSAAKAAELCGERLGLRRAAP
ncbi:MAG TPA: hypothetical protein VF816_11605 [Rhodocyclaceae bacterium]